MNLSIKLFITGFGLVCGVAAGSVIVKAMDVDIPHGNKAYQLPTPAVVPSAAPKTSSVPLPTTKVTNGLPIKSLKLNDDNSVFLTGPIGPNALDIAKEITEKANKGPVTLVLNSPGGSVLHGAQIISAMEAAKFPVYTLCTQMCASMAAMIHSYGAERWIVNRSVLMYHNAAGGVQGSFPQIRSRFAVIDRYVNKMLGFTANRSGQGVAAFQVKIDSELWIDGEDSVNEHYSDSLAFINELKLKKPTAPSLFDDEDRNTRKLLVPNTFDIIWMVPIDVWKSYQVEEKKVK